MNELDLSQLNFTEKDIQNFVNSSEDVKKDSVLFIDHENKDTLSEYVANALSKNPKKIITSMNCEIDDGKIIKVKNYKKILEDSYKYLCSDYSKKTYFGITGTNGKTTTGQYLQQLLGEKTLFIGTNNENLFEGITTEKHLTSPKLFNILKLLGKSENRHYKNVVLEASSHALDQDRFEGIKFDTSSFTNLSQDHFDYHENFENYFNSKLKLFSKKLSNRYVYVDNEWGKKIADKTDIPSFKIGTDSTSDIKIIQKDSYPKTSIKVLFQDKQYDLKPNIVGPNFYLNFLVAVGMACFSEKISMENVIENIGNLKNPDGRFSSINFKKNKIIIDYAHTPDSISSIISYVRDYYSKIILIFGAGGGRDKQKRKLMGIASQNADKIIVTNDNPRVEEPEAIANDILMGCDINKTEVILDRKDAITYGINQLNENSVLLVLGKGHEMFQEINNSKFAYNDEKFIMQILGELN